VPLTFLKPFLINYMAQQASTIDTMSKDNEARKAKEVTQKTEEDNTPILGGSRLMLTQGPVSQASTPTPYGQTNGVMSQPTGYGGFR